MKAQSNLSFRVSIPVEVRQAATFVRDHADEIREDIQWGDERAARIVYILGHENTHIFRKLVDAVEDYQSYLRCPVSGHIGYRHLCD